MRAWVCESYQEPTALVLKDVRAMAPESHEVQIRTRAVGISFGESLILAGKYQLSPPLPYIPSSEMAGEVVAVGSHVTRFKPGDPVVMVSFTLSGGGLQELCTVREDFVFRKPAALTFSQTAGLTSNYYTVYNALIRRGAVQRGEVLVVHGATGGVGVAAVQMGRLLGTTVIATGGDDKKLEIVRALGAHHVINYRTASVRDEIRNLTDGRGADVYFDPVGGHLFDLALRAIAPGGRILVVGFTSGRFASAPTNILLVKMVSVIGVEGRLSIETTNGRGMTDFMDLLAWADRGDIIPHIGAVYPFEEAAAAFERLKERDVVGKIVVEVVD